MADFHITIIGGGVVGLALAARLSKSRSNILLLEKNVKYGMETSSRNSEVIHAGIYYSPGSLKARLCVEGRDELYAICSKHAIPHRRLTKLITAVGEEEKPVLERIYTNGRQNGVELEMLDAASAKKLEPNIHTCGAIYSPMSGVISAHALMDYLFHVSVNAGVTVQHRCEVVGIEKTSDGYRVDVLDGGQRGSVTSEIVINAAGLFADRIAQMVGIDIDAAGYRQYFAKGSYFSVVPAKWKLVSRLIYPVPRDEGLGVHAVLDVAGRLRFGPDVEYLNDGVLDYSVSESKLSAFAEAIGRIVPSIQPHDLVPDMSGIRPKLQRKGEPPKDFVICHEKDRGLEGFVNLIGIDSPGLTAAPAIGRYVEALLE